MTSHHGRAPLALRFGVRLTCLSGLAALALSACDPIEIAGSVVGTTVYGASSPAHEIEQIYYLGTFDPQEQLPPTIYRVRVHGQASAISSTGFASGWVPAEFIDSLNTHIGFDVNDPRQPNVRLTDGEKELRAQLETGRRLVQFGPEGFRDVPKDHRLVIVMGASPEAFFQAIDEALGEFGELRREQSATALKSELFEALVKLGSHQQRLDDLGNEIEIEVVRADQQGALPEPGAPAETPSGGGASGSDGEDDRGADQADRLPPGTKIVEETEEETERKTTKTTTVPEPAPGDDAEGSGT